MSANPDPGNFDVLLIGDDPRFVQIALVLTQASYRPLRIPSVDLLYAISDHYAYNAIFIMWDVLRIYTGSRLLLIQRLRFGPNVNTPVLCFVEHAAKDAELDMLVQNNVVNCMLDPKNLQWNILKQCVDACKSSIQNYLQSSARQLIALTHTKERKADMGLINYRTVESADNGDCLLQTKQRRHSVTNSEHLHRKKSDRGLIEMDLVRKKLVDIQKRREKGAHHVELCDSPKQTTQSKRQRYNSSCEDEDGDALIIDLTNEEENAVNQSQLQQQLSDVPIIDLTQNEEIISSVKQSPEDSASNQFISRDQPPQLTPASCAQVVTDDRSVSLQPPKLASAYSPQLDKIEKSWRKSSTSSANPSSCSSTEDMDGVHECERSACSSSSSGKITPELRQCYVQLKNMHLEATDVLLVSD